MTGRDRCSRHYICCHPPYLLTRLFLFKQLFSLNTDFSTSSCFSCRSQTSRSPVTMFGRLLRIALRKTSTAASGLISLHWFCSSTEEPLKRLHSIKKIKDCQKIYNYFKVTFLPFNTSGKLII